VSSIATKHKIRHYSDLFSPAEITLECLDINSQLLMLGGWDGCISTYSRKGDEYIFEDIQPVAEVPIKQIKMVGKTFVHDQ
jgi:hypothetical protein